MWIKSLMSLSHLLKDWPFFIALGSLIKIYLTVWGFISVSCSRPFVFSILMILFLLVELYIEFWSQIIWFIYSLILFWLLGFLDIKEESVYECVHACPSAAWGSQRTTFRNRFFPLSSGLNLGHEACTAHFYLRTILLVPSTFPFDVVLALWASWRFCMTYLCPSVDFNRHCVRSAIWGST